jgi:hypothetical protein
MTLLVPIAHSGGLFEKGQPHSHIYCEGDVFSVSAPRQNGAKW